MAYLDVKSVNSNGIQQLRQEAQQRTTMNSELERRILAKEGEAATLRRHHALVCIF